MTLNDVLARIQSPDRSLLIQAQARLDRLTKPVGSLGRLEEIGAQYAMLTGEMMTVSHPHNAFLEAYLDMGIVGLALLLYYYLHVWRGFRALGSNAYLSPEMRGFFQGATAALVVFFVTAMAGSSLRPDSEFGYLWLAIGMMYGMLARRPAG